MQRAMAEVRKFLFETEFEVDRKHGKNVGVVDNVVTRQDLAAARAEGFEAGREAGKAEAAAERARFEAEVLAMIGQQIASLVQQRSSALATMRKEGVALAVSIARRLAGRLLAAHPLSEVEALVEDCLQRLMGEARIVVRIRTDLLDAMQTKLDGLTRKLGFAGQIILFAEDDLAAGDCRVEWADGGAIRTATSLEAEIDGLLDRLLDGPNDAAETRRG